MKISKFLAATLAATTLFASCSKEQAGTEPAGAYTLEVNLPDNVVPAGRGIETPVNGGTNVKTAITDVTVFVVLHDLVTKVETFTAAELSAMKKHIEDVGQSTTEVIVVANIPTAVAPAVRALTSATAVKNYAYTIASQSGTGITGLVHLGSALSSAFVTDTNPVDTHEYKKVTVNLQSRTARIQYAGGLTAGTGITSIKLEAVLINRYFTDGAATSATAHAVGSPFWATTPSTATSPAATAFSAPTFSAAYPVPQYRDMFSSAVDGTTQVYAYNLFAGNYLPTFNLLVSGEYATGYYAGSNKYFLQWVSFNKFTDNGTSTDLTGLAPNKIYKIGSIAVPAASLVIDPGTGKLDLGVTVTVEDWTDVNVTPGIQ